MKFEKESRQPDHTEVFLESEDDGLKRRMVSLSSNKILCECNGTRIDILKCLSVISSFGIFKENELLFENDHPAVQGEFTMSISACLDCLKRGMEKLSKASGLL
jgi:hypothetical protein